MGTGEGTFDQARYLGAQDDEGGYDCAQVEPEGDGHGLAQRSTKEEAADEGDDALGAHRQPLCRSLQET